MDKTDRQVKNKARRSQLRCDYILGRRDIVETSKSRQLHRAREMKTFNDLGFFINFFKFLINQKSDCMMKSPA